MLSGGALSQLAAFDIALDQGLALSPDQIVCYSVAAPRTGNHAFAAAYNAVVPHTWNVINDQANFPSQQRSPSQKPWLLGRFFWLKNVCR